MSQFLYNQLLLQEKYKCLNKSRNQAEVKIENHELIQTTVPLPCIKLVSCHRDEVADR